MLKKLSTGILALTISFQAMAQSQTDVELDSENQTEQSETKTIEGVQTFINNADETVQLKNDSDYYVSAENLVVRETENPKSRVLGRLYLDDLLKIVVLTPPTSNLVGVKIKRSSTFRAGVQSGQTYFVSKRFLSHKNIMSKQSPYFVIQNVATEVTRVYKRCTESSNCAHQLVFEAKMVVGKPEEGTENNRNAYKTKLGHSRITEWIKFYQDGSGKYVPWYSKGQSIASIPGPAPKKSNGQPDTGLSWGKTWQQERDGVKRNYGAFGWYAGKLHPASGRNGVDFQWLHGTIGWGTDGEAPIEITRSILLNMFANPGSAGCTRLSNPSIAYLRELLPTGTDVYRVYARESTRESTCRKRGFLGGCNQENIFYRYSNQYNPLPWSFTLLTNDPQTSGGITSDTRALYNKGYQFRVGYNVIEQGTHLIDQYPTAFGSEYNYQPSSGRTGDRYELDDVYGDQPTQFRGTFVVDEGRFIDYAHPANSKIVVGGLPEFQTKVPSYLQTNGTYYPAEIRYKTKQNHN